MTKDKNYTMQDVIDEVAKCRVLCLHCHIIHTRNQRKEGIVSNKTLSSIRRKT